MAPDQLIIARRGPDIAMVRGRLGWLPAEDLSYELSGTIAIFVEPLLKSGWVG